jgi:hypothetical protein
MLAAAAVEDAAAGQLSSSIIAAVHEHNQSCQAPDALWTAQLLLQLAVRCSVAA